MSQFLQIIKLRIDKKFSQQRLKNIDKKGKSDPIIKNYLAGHFI